MIFERNPLSSYTLRNPTMWVPSVFFPAWYEEDSSNDINMSVDPLNWRDEIAIFEIDMSNAAQLAKPS